MKVENLLLDLIKIPSPSGKEEKLARFIADILKKDFSVKFQKTNESVNLLAVKGMPKVMFNAHLDTIGKELKVEQKNGIIYGRGACDTKSQIAAMVIAAEQLDNISLLFDSCEEKNFSGIKKAVSLIPKSIKRIIVGEPTNLDLITGQKGLLTIKVICRGKEAHGSMPEKGENAIEKLMKVLKKLKSQNLGKNKVLGKTTMNIGQISGGKAPNLVPDYAEAIIDIRTADNPKKLFEKLKKSLDAEVISMYVFNPVFSDIATKLKLKKRAVPYFTETYFLDKKAKTILIGAGKEQYAHSNKEQVDIKSVKKLVDIYVRLAKEVN